MKIQVIGAGSFGLCLARLLSVNGHEVHLWARNTQDLERLRTTRESPDYLPGVSLPETLVMAQEILAEPDLAVFAVPSHAMRETAGRFRFSDHTVRVSVAKGIENDTLLRMSEVLATAGRGGPVVVLSGPGHAEEIAADLPASVVVASASGGACEQVQQAFFNRTFRVYTSGDVVGVELGGALKNIIAIAAGVCDGFSLGDSAKAALLTRGLAEMVRLGEACGADPLTFAGLSGMGDLIVTCMSRHSRNRRVGELLAQGQTLEEIEAASKMVAEGVRTTKSVHGLARKHQVDMPICEAVHAALYEGMNPMEAMQRLLMREAKPEFRS